MSSIVKKLQLPPLQCGHMALLNLPPEIKLQIMTLLEYQDLFRIQYTCKNLYTITATRSVWQNLISRHNLIFSRDKAIEAYTSKELQQRVKRLLSVEANWSSENPSFLRRELPDGSAIFLVPGGRWLLVAASSGSITYFDLDATYPSPKLLLQPAHELDHSSYGPSNLTIDLDEDSPHLKFRFAYVIDNDFRWPQPPWRLCLWEIELCDHGGDAVLTASHIKSFYLYGQGHTVGTSLRGDYFARSVLNGWHDHKIEVYDWTTSNSDSQRRPIFHPPWGTESIRLLADNKLLLMTESAVCIYATCGLAVLSGRKELVPPEPFTPEAPCLFSEQLPGTHRWNPNLSQPVTNSSNDARFVFSTTSGIYDLCIPAGLESKSGWTEVLPSSGMVRPGSQYAYFLDCSLGSQRAFALQHESMFLITYNQNKKIEISTEKAGVEHLQGMEPLMDESTGRVVLRSDSKLLVFDFAL